MLNLRRGDTIIEVMFGITVFSMIAISSLAIMNSGINSTQRALETTLVREQMNNQAELLRYIQQAATFGSSDARTVWKKLLSTTDAGSYGVTSASTYGLSAGATTCPSTPPSKSFFINPGTPISATPASSIKSGPTTILINNSAAPPYAQVADDGSKSYGMWVESVVSNTSPKYIDFNIRACWDSVGTPLPMTLGTIVRLYDPAQ